MPVAPSFNDLLAQFLAEALARRPELQFRDGDITQAQQHGAGAMADAVLRFAAQCFKETFLDGARGDALTALVDDRVGLPRNPATAAQVQVTFARTSGGAAETFLAGTIVASEFDADGNEVRFTLDAPAIFGVGDNGDHTVPATAIEVGRNGNVASGGITRIITSHVDQTFTVTNISDAAGGNEEESDPELRRRARAFFLTLRAGTLAALEFAALSVPTVRTARATEDVNGLVSLVVADADGNSSPQMQADVLVAIEAVRAAGSIVTVFGGTRLQVDVNFTMTLAQGVSAAVVGPLAEDAMEAEMQTLQQGDPLILQRLAAAAIAVDPAGIRFITFAAPLADVTPSAFQTIRPGTVTGT